MELTIELDDARELMYEVLSDELDEDALETTVQKVVQDKVTELYDNREHLAKSDT